MLFCPCICVSRCHGHLKCEFAPALGLERGGLSTRPSSITHLEGKGEIPESSNHPFFSVLTPWWRAWSCGRAVLLAVCRQGGTDAEGLVQQPVFQNVEDWLVHRNYLHAVCDDFHPW